MNSRDTRRAFPLFHRLRFIVRWWMGFLLAAGGAYGAIFLETGTRARSSFRDAEQYHHWFQNPPAMDRDLEAAYAKAMGRLSAPRGKGESAEEDLRLERDILEARFLLRRAESPAKRAYFSYRDVYRLFSPPETDLSRRARLLAPAAKQAWREDVERHGLPVTEAMFDPEPGETAERRAVFSSRDGFEASNLAAILRSKGVAAGVFDGARVSGAAHQGFWVTVSPSDFWRAHNEIKSLIAPDLSPVFGPS